MLRRRDEEGIKLNQSHFVSNSRQIRSDNDCMTNELSFGDR